MDVRKLRHFRVWRQWIRHVDPIFLWSRHIGREAWTRLPAIIRLFTLSGPAVLVTKMLREEFLRLEESVTRGALVWSQVGIVQRTSVLLGSGPHRSLWQLCDTVRVQSSRMLPSAKSYRLIPPGIAAESERTRSTAYIRTRHTLPSA